jgi:hypothetical protein
VRTRRTHGATSMRKYRSLPDGAASGSIDPKALPRRRTLSRPRAESRCALKGHTKGNQSLAALDLEAESTENVPFFASVTRPDKTTSSSIRFWRGARAAQIDLIEGANAV